jgi:hypothetical protein
MLATGTSKGMMFPISQKFRLFLRLDPRIRPFVRERTVTRRSDPVTAGRYTSHGDSGGAVASFLAIEHRFFLGLAEINASN